MPLDQPVPPDIENDPVEQHRMGLGEHLEELRRRIVFALIGPLAIAPVMLYFGRDIAAWLMMPYTEVLHTANLAPRLVAQSPMEGFTVYFKLSLIAALIAAAPWVIYQLWQFIATGLYPRERRVVYLLVPFSGIMSAAGVLFTYYIMLPVVLTFLVFFTIAYPAPEVDVGREATGPMSRVLSMAADAAGARDPEATVDADSPEQVPPQRLPLYREDPTDPTNGQAWINVTTGELRVMYGDRLHAYAPRGGQSVVEPLPRYNEYVGFVALLMLGIVIAFQLPVIMLTLGWIGTVSPQWVAKYRIYAVLICFVLGAVLTPQDPISMLILAIPLWLLFELGLLLMRWAYREPEQFDPGDPLGLSALDERDEEHKD